MKGMIRWLLTRCLVLGTGAAAERFAQERDDVPTELSDFRCLKL